MPIADSPLININLEIGRFLFCTGQDLEQLLHVSTDYLLWVTKSTLQQLDS